MKPVRVQLSRRKGWRMPANTVKVDRSTEWGNCFAIGDKLCSGTVRTAEQAVKLFREFLDRGIAPGEREQVFRDLRGKNLACWCKPGAPCHADVLLEIANAEVKRRASRAARGPSA